MKKFREIYQFFLNQDKALYKGFVSISSLRIIEKLSGLIISIFVFRLLTKEDVAAYGYIQTIVAICSIFCIQEITNTVQQSVSRGFYGTFIKSMPVVFLSSIIGAMVISVFVFWYSLNSNVNMIIGFLIAMLTFPFFQGIRQWRGVYLGEKNFNIFSKAEAINAILKTILILISLFLYPQNYLIPLCIYFLVPSIQNIYRSYICLKKIPKDAPYEDGSLKYSFHASIYSGANIIADNIDRLLLLAFLPHGQVAIYMAAEKFSDLIQGVVQDMAAVLAPKFAVTEKYTTSLDKKLKLLAWSIGICIVFFAIVILPYLIPLIFSASYEESIVYAQILVCAVAVRNISSLRFRFIRSKIDVYSFRTITVYSAIAHIIISCTLIPFFGLYGAVASVFLHRLILSLIVDYIIKSRYLIHDP